MGWSGKSGTVTIQDTTKGLDGVYDVTGSEGQVAEVTQWEIEDKAKLTSYSHSDSGGFDDVCVGTYSITGSFDLKLKYMGAVGSGTDGLDVADLGFPLYAGSVVWLDLNSAAIGVSGYGVIESLPISVKVDGGEPISATYRFRSKGPWVYLNGTGDDGNY